MHQKHWKIKLSIGVTDSVLLPSIQRFLLLTISLATRLRGRGRAHRTGHYSIHTCRTYLWSVILLISLSLHVNNTILYTTLTSSSPLLYSTIFHAILISMNIAPLLNFYLFIHFLHTLLSNAITLAGSITIRMKK